MPTVFARSRGTEQKTAKSANSSQAPVPVDVTPTDKSIMAFSIFERDEKIAVSSPYHPSFPPRARQLGGTWDAGRLIWLFDPRDEERVRGLCEEVYGPGFKDAASAVPHYFGHRRR